MWTSFHLHILTQPFIHSQVLSTNTRGDLYGNAKNWLKIWSSDKEGDQHSHGIPQGPMASDFLAECILLSIDEKMSEQYSYFRYVDDVRILGKTELEVRQALVCLDILCKSRGLIPNSDKTKIKKVSSADELVEGIPDVKSYFDDGSGSILSKTAAQKRVLDAVEIKDKIEVKDRTLFRYILFRSPQSEDILEIVLGTWEHYPEHTDAYVAFLENYQRSDGVVSLAIRLLESKYPYDYVQGELWKLAARMSSKSELSQLVQLAIDTVRNPNSGTASKFGVYVFLCQCDKVGLGNYEKWIMYEKKSLVQALVAPYLQISTSGGIEACKIFLSRTLSDTYLGLVRPLVESGINLNSFCKNPVQFPVVAQQVYNATGISGHVIPSPDAIGNLIAKRYSVKKWNKWKDLLQGEYDHAFMELKFADLHFESHLSSWLNYQDAFNEIVFRSLQIFLANKSVAGAISLVNKNGDRLDYGVLLGNSNFKSTFPILQDGLQKTHSRRNSAPGSHPYDKKTGNKASPLKKREQVVLKQYLDNVFDQIIKITEGLGI
jgi:hypothetical protein